MSIILSHAFWAVIRRIYGREAFGSSSGTRLLYMGFCVSSLFRDGYHVSCTNETLDYIFWIINAVDAEFIHIIYMQMESNYQAKSANENWIFDGTFLKHIFHLSVRYWKHMIDFLARFANATSYSIGSYVRHSISTIIKF